MKKLNLLVSCAAVSILLAGCNSGSSDSTTSGDTQSFSVTTDNGLAVGYLVTNCRIISPNGTCSADLYYQATTDSAIGSSVGLELPAGYTASPNPCPTMTTLAEQKCSITITATSTATTNQAQMVTVLVNDQAIPGDLGMPGLFFYVGDNNN